MPPMTDPFAVPASPNPTTARATPAAKTAVATVRSRAPPALVAARAPRHPTPPVRGDSPSRPIAPRVAPAKKMTWTIDTSGATG